LSRLAAALLAALAWLAAAGGAFAHAMPNSLLVADFGPDAVRIEATLPWAELKYALPPDLAEPPPSLAPRTRAILEAYARAHLSTTTPDGRPFAATLQGLEVVHSADHADLRAVYGLRPPPGAEPEPLALRFDGVTHVVMSHVVLVFAAEDGGEPRLAGVLQNPRSTLVVAPARSAGFLAAFALGARHIAEGADHLLFLLTLLLPAPLLAQGGRWAGRKSLRQTLLALTAVVTAFTVGHTLTLVAAATLDLRPPERPVEVAVAASILVAALGAWRPLLLEGRAAPLVAGGFGLVHGLAFSSAVREHLDAPQGRLEALAGFNLGIEAVQLLIVLVAAPVLIALARSPAYHWIRPGAAGAAGAAAVVWVAARSVG
jgi:hypothetical protein